ncbi:hypothetical protein VTO42DRAFT_1229 [Malbranchea cinnamomea]
MSEYTSASGSFPNRFCGNCSTSIMMDISKSRYLHSNYALSVRTLEGIEDILDKVEYHHFDWKKSDQTPVQSARSIAELHAGTLLAVEMRVLGKIS